MNHLKRHCFHAIGILLALLIVCLGQGAAAMEQTPAAPKDMMQAYEDVMLGNRRYVQCNFYDDVVEEVFMQSEISLWYGFVFEVPIRFIAFSITDLDADGNPELLLQLSEDFGYELLRYQDGLVYGYPFFARAMEDVTADGDIHGSNGADNFGWYRAGFDAEVMETADICWKYDDLGPGIQFFIGDTEVTEAEFAARCDEIEAKERLTWTEYTLENLHAAVTGE